MKGTAVVTSLSVFLLLNAVPGVAQLPGIPVYNTPIPGGFSLAADAAFPSSSTLLGSSYAATGAFGVGAFGFTLSVGGTSIEVDTFNLGQVAAGGTANWKVFGKPMSPLSVNVQAGVAFWEIGDPPPSLTTPDTLVRKLEQFRVPVGVSAMWTIPTSGLAIKPWIAPRLDYNVLRFKGETSTRTESRSDFAFSIGLEVAFLNGLGIRAAYDWQQPDNEVLSTIGVGLTYSFRKPGS
jgi:opacity protein-like surface antigen